METEYKQMKKGRTPKTVLDVVLNARSPYGRARTSTHVAFELGFQNLWSAFSQGW